VRLREVRAGDVPRLAELLRSEFPEEERLVGTRPETVVAVARRLFRWETRALLGLLRLVGRSPFRLFVVEEGGRLVATTLLSFPARAGFLSMVVVDPAYRRRGYARSLIARATAAAARRGRRFVALDVLESNAPARALYDSLGFRPLRSVGYFVHDAPSTAAGTANSDALRPFSRRDAPALAVIADDAAPAAVRELFPARPGDFRGSRWAGRVLASRGAAWVYDRGRGPEAYVAATHSPATEAGHLSAPVVGEEVPPDQAVALLRTAVAWLASAGVPRVLCRAADDDPRARSALEGAGFRPALRFFTLVRPSS
jgi:GNAT superfamily N-acetyltransferase